MKSKFLTKLGRVGDCISELVLGNEPSPNFMAKQEPCVNYVRGFVCRQGSASGLTCSHSCVRHLQTSCPTAGWYRVVLAEMALLHLSHIIQQVVSGSFS